MAKEVKAFERGTYLYEQGDCADSLLIVAEGKVRVSRHLKGKTVILGEFEAPAVLGEDALIPPRRHWASAKALSEGFVRHIEGPEELAENTKMLLHLFAQRNRFTYERVAWETYTGTLERTASILARLAPEDDTIISLTQGELGEYTGSGRVVINTLAIVPLQNAGIVAPVLERGVRKRGKIEIKNREALLKVANGMPPSMAARQTSDSKN